MNFVISECDRPLAMENQIGQFLKGRGDSMQNAQSLQEWANANEPSKELIYSGGYWEQIIFIRDRIIPLLSSDYEAYKQIRDTRAKVIAYHKSKSVKLPVVRIALDEHTAFTMRCNFYNWMVSVESPHDVQSDFTGLFEPNKEIHHVYCEGFPKHLVYGSYTNSKRMFTVELPGDNYHIFTFFWLIGSEIKRLRV